MKRFVFNLFTGVCVIFLLTSFFGNSMSPKRKVAYKITSHLGKKFEKKYGLRNGGISEGVLKGKYKTIGLELDYDKILSKDAGRELLLNCASEMLHAFNSCQPFHQYMADYPFTGDNIIVNIFVRDPVSYDVYHPDIAVFSFYNNKLIYKSDTPESERKGSDYYSKEVETIEEARKIVKEQNRNKEP